MKVFKVLLLCSFVSICFPSFAGDTTAVDSLFEIYTVEDLYEFARIVNSGKKGQNARVMNDIIVNENVLDEEGNLNGDTFRVWRPITHDYSGVFDGNGHVVKGLYIPNGGDQAGMFISINKALIKNFGIEDSYYSNSQGRSGGICGQTWYATITNCYFQGVIKCLGSEVGGITSSCNGGSEISNCYSIAKLSGASRVHGICPVNKKSIIKNSYYYEKDYTSTIEYKDTFNVLSMTSEQFANGEVCYKLNNGVVDGTQVFYQNLDEARVDTFRTIDNYPVFDKSHLTVYTNDTIYYNILFTGVEDLLSEFSDANVYVVDKTIVICNVDGNLSLTDLNGYVLYSGLVQRRDGEYSCVEIPVRKGGVYIVVVDGSSCKIIVR